MTFLRGTVGILSLDALELCPEWGKGGDGGSGSGDAHTKGEIGASATAGSGAGAEAEGTGNNKGGGKGAFSEEEPPLIGDAQWQRLRTTLEEQVHMNHMALHLCM